MPSGGYLLAPITYVAQRSPDDKVQNGLEQKQENIYLFKTV